MREATIVKPQVGAIGTAWQRQKLSELSTIRAGIAFPPRLQGQVRGDLPFYKVSDMNLPGNETVMKEANHYLMSHQIGEIKGKPFPAGTVIFPKVGAAIATNKKRLLSRSSLIDNNVMGIIPDNEKCTSEFLYYWLLTVDLASISAPGPLPSITGSSVGQLTVPLPPLDEQRRLTEMLLTIQDAATANAIELSAARSLKDAMLTYLFANGLTDEGQAIETEYGSIPQDWSLIELSEVATIQTGVTKGRRLNGQATVSLPYLRVANVQDGHLDLRDMKTISLAEHEVPRYMLMDGDVVVTEGGDADKLGRGFIWRNQISPCVHQNHVFAIRPDRSRLLPEYLAYLIQSSFAKSYFLGVAHRTTNLACINSTKLKAMPTPLPSIAEQHDIVNYLAHIDRKIAAVERQASAVGGLFNSMLEVLLPSIEESE
jgi:type I restriction enzyme S subunit